MHVWSAGEPLPASPKKGAADNPDSDWEDTSDSLEGARHMDEAKEVPCLLPCGRVECCRSGPGRRFQEKLMEAGMLKR